MVTLEAKLAGLLGAQGTIVKAELAIDIAITVDDWVSLVIDVGRHASLDMS